MVEQAIRQTYTYYHPNEPRGKVVPNERLAGRGKAWTLGAYNHPTYPSPLNVRVGDAGIKVWMVISWLKLCDGDVDAVLKRYPVTVTREDIEAARWYYDQAKDAIDRKLAEEAEIA